MFIRSLTRAGLVASTLVLASSSAAFAAPAATAQSSELLSTATHAVTTAQGKTTAQLHASSTGTAGDPANDALASADITNTSLHFDLDAVTASVTLAQAVTPTTDPAWASGQRMLAVGLSFNHTGYVGGIIAYGTDGAGHITAMASNQFGELCPSTSLVQGNVITLSTPASCFDRPGAVDYTAVYGNFYSDFTKLGTNQSDVDVAPDSGFISAGHEPGGYWLLGQDGGVFSFGDANFYGSTGDMKLNRPVVGMSSMPGGNGYRFVASDGGVFDFGSATFHGSTGDMALNAPVVGMATTPSGHGYWLVASDGGIFAFGDAKFYGSTGDIKLNQPIVGMTSTKTGNGYWMVASDGGVFAFGDTNFYGSTGGMKLNLPVTALGVSPNGNGYYLLASDGGIFSFGDAPFLGSAVGLTYGAATAIDVEGGGYRVADDNGGVVGFGSVYYFGDLVDLGVFPNAPIIGLASTHS